MNSIENTEAGTCSTYKCIEIEKILEKKKNSFRFQNPNCQFPQLSIIIIS